MEGQAGTLPTGRAGFTGRRAGGWGRVRQRRGRALSRAWARRSRLMFGNNSRGLETLAFENYGAANSHPAAPAILEVRAGQWGGARLRLISSKTIRFGADHT